MSEKTNGVVTRETMASGDKTGKRRNSKPRVSSVAGRRVRAEARIKGKPVTNDRQSRGFHTPGSMNVRKVGR